MPHTSTHSHCTPTHRATHINPQPLHIDPPSHAHPPTATAHRPTEPRTISPQPLHINPPSHALPRTSYRTRASQPLGTLPPCNAPLQTRLAAARRSATLRCSPTDAPPRRSALCHPAMPRFGAASSVGRERLVLVASLLPLAQSQRSPPPPSSSSPLPCWRSPHRGY